MEEDIPEEELYDIARYDQHACLYVGARTAVPNLHPIRDFDLQRLFKRNQTPTVPQHGLSLEKATIEAEKPRNDTGEGDGINDQDLDDELGESDTSDGQRRKRMRLAAREAEKRAEEAPKTKTIGLVLNRADDDRLIEFTKNRLLFRFCWAKTLMATTVVRDCHGIDEEHPDWSRSEAICLNNRATLQHKFFEKSHGFGKAFWESTVGKEEYTKNWAGKLPYLLTTTGEKRPRLVAANLFPASFRTLTTALAVFDGCKDGLDVSSLIKSEDTETGTMILTRQGELLCARAFAVIQLETTYITTWLDTKGNYVKKAAKHNRPDWIIDYLGRIDRINTRYVEMPDGRKFGRLFKMPKNSGQISGVRGGGPLVVQAVANEIPFQDGEDSADDWEADVDE